MFLVSLLTALFIARESLPILNFFFYPLLVLSAVYTLVVLAASAKFIIKLNRKGAAGVYLPFMLVALFVVIAVVNSEYTPLAFSAEFINLGVAIILVIMYFSFIHDKEQFFWQRNLFFRILFYLMTAVSILGLAKFWFYLRGIEVPFLFSEERFALGTSLILNTELFITPIVAAMIGVILFKFRQKSYLHMSVLYHLSFLAMFYTVLWSGSKKGLLMMIILFAVIVLLRIFFILHKSRARNYNLIKNLNVLILVIGFSALLGTWAINVLPGEKKEEWISRLGFDNYHFKSEMTLITHSHISTFDFQADLQRWYDRLWGNYEADEKAMQDKITFVLVEQENIFVAPERSRWAVQAYDRRLERWTSSKALFLEYSKKEKLSGRGFRYLNDFSVLSAWDHSANVVHFMNNYLVSSLLYSGLAGLLALMWLLLQVFRIYWINRRDLIALFAIFFVFGLMFLLTHNTILSNPLLLVACIMPLRFRTIDEP